MSRPHQLVLLRSMPGLPYPAPRESVRSWLLRIACQLMLSPLQLGRAVGLVADRWLAATGLMLNGAPRQTLARVLDIDESRLLSLDGHRSVGRPVWTVRSRACFVCLAVLPAWQITWRLPWVSSCPEHRVVLADRCPGCGHLLRSNSAAAPTGRLSRPSARRPAGSCDVDLGGEFCGTVLTHLEVEQADESVVDVTELRDASEDSPLPDMVEYELLRAAPVSAFKRTGGLVGDVWSDRSAVRAAATSALEAWRGNSPLPPERAAPDHSRVALRKLTRQRPALSAWVEANDNLTPAGYAVLPPASRAERLADLPQAVSREQWLPFASVLPVEIPGRAVLAYWVARHLVAGPWQHLIDGLGLPFDAEPRLQPHRRKLRRLPPPTLDALLAQYRQPTSLRRRDIRLWLTTSAPQHLRGTKDAVAVWEHLGGGDLRLAPHTRGRGDPAVRRHRERPDSHTQASLQLLVNDAGFPHGRGDR